MHFLVQNMKNALFRTPLKRRYLAFLGANNIFGNAKRAVNDLGVCELNLDVTERRVWRGSNCNFTLFVPVVFVGFTFLGKSI